MQCGKELLLETSPITYMLEGNRWILKDGRYQIKWYDGGDQVPRVLGQVLGHDVLDEDGDDNDEHLVGDCSDDNEEYDVNEPDQSDL